MVRGEHGVPIRLLVRIGWQGKEVIKTMVSTASGPAHAVYQYDIAVPQMMIPIQRHYWDRCEEEMRIPGERLRTIADLIIWELLLNAAEHGNRWDQKRSIWIMLWLGDKGLIIGCRDEGDFFKRQKTKQRFEARERVHHHDKSGRGKGTKFMYRQADAIEIDEKSGTVFLALDYFKERGDIWIDT